MKTGDATPVGTDDQPGALGTLVAAFVQDPVMRWLYPDASQYLRHFPEFLVAFGGKAFDEGTSWSLPDLTAVALWLPPGIAPDGDQVVDKLISSVTPDLHADLLAVLEQMDAAHPTYPVWYLPWFGVDPIRQNLGLGSALLASTLESADSDHLPAYLETPNPRNIPFYERHGFEVVGQAQHGSCPPVAGMLRAAR